MGFFSFWPPLTLHHSCPFWPLMNSVDALFWWFAVPAILLVGVSKGGLGGGLGMLGVPLMAQVAPPTQAAAVMLPILVVMDLVGLYAYRGRWSLPMLKVLVPAAGIGIGLGALSFEMLDATTLKRLLGVMSVLFALRYFWAMWHARPLKLARPWEAWFWGGTSGLTSFVAHAGGPPVNMYLLRSGLDKTTYQATSVVYFALINFIKLFPYALLGQFSALNLELSAWLAPLAPLGVGLGYWLHGRINQRLFFQLAHLFMLMAGLRLMVA